jgi:hypothetical protein
VNSRLLRDVHGPRRSVRALSSVGRAPPLQGGGRGFESLSAHEQRHSSASIPVERRTRLRASVLEPGSETRSTPRGQSRCSDRRWTTSPGLSGHVALPSRRMARISPRSIARRTFAGEQSSISAAFAIDAGNRPSDFIDPPPLSVSIWFRANLAANTLSLREVFGDGGSEEGSAGPRPLEGQGLRSLPLPEPSTPRLHHSRRTGADLRFAQARARPSANRRSAPAPQKGPRCAPVGRASLASCRRRSRTVLRLLGIPCLCVDDRFLDRHRRAVVGKDTVRVLQRH